MVNELSTKEEDSTFNFVPPTIFCFCIWLDVKARYRLPRSSPQRHINENVASTSLLFWCHRFPNNPPPPPRSGQLKRDFNWSIRCVRKILQQEMWRTNIGWTFGELWQISESYYLSKLKCVKTISIHNLQNYGWFSIKFKGAILWKSLRAGSRKDKEKIWTDAVIDAVVVTLSNFRK